MINIYQLFPRLFGNRNTHCVKHGSIIENGCGHFVNIDDNALKALSGLGFSHIWLTGVLRHATQTEYNDIGLKGNHPDITKGKAGSPYSITDYYDLDPDLAETPSERMSEFEQLVDRIHSFGIKVIIDFVPNHLSREYHSHRDDIEQFGKHDNDKVFFSPDNNFYYCPGQDFVAPVATCDDAYHETPAKATGNDVFRPNPSINDWYDTVKLNYGIDYGDGSRHFDHIPDTWNKMLHIVKFWCSKGVDGFRVDMAEMVPVEFWRWMIADVKSAYNVLFIAEIYQPGLYSGFIEAGFDYLYDKMDFYNTVERVMTGNASASAISDVWKSLNGYDDKMLRFMENHDEKRLASPHFLGDAYVARPAMVLAALMNKGPLMIYNGQACGEPALGAQGYSGDDGRTSIFDYCAMPNLQRWINGGLFDGALLDEGQKGLFDFYKELLVLRNGNEAFCEGAFYDLMWCNPWYSHFDPQFVYAFLRYTDKQRVLVVVNFNRHESRTVQVKIPADALELMGMKRSSGGMDDFDGDVYEVCLPPSGFKMLYL